MYGDHARKLTRFRALSPGYDFMDSLHSGGFTYGSAAVGLESIQIKHEDDLPDWLL